MRQPGVSILTVPCIDYMTLGVFLSITHFMSRILVLVNMLGLSALIQPSMFCFVWLELGLGQLHFSSASWLLVRLFRRGWGRVRLPSCILHAILIDFSQH